MDLSEAEKLSKSILRRKRSERTEADYLAAQKLLGDLTPQQYRDAVALIDGKLISKSHFLRLKAAYQVGCARKVLECLKGAKVCMDGGDFGGADASNYEAIMWGEKLAAQKPDYKGERFKKRLGTAHPGQYSKARRGANSFKKHIGPLNRAFPNHGWQKRIINEMPEQHKFPITLLALTGCRIAEIMNAKNQIEFFMKEGKLVVTIYGAKMTDNSGQEWRTLTFDPETDPFAEDFIQMLQSRKSDHYCFEKTQQALHKSHQRAVKRALGKKWVRKCSLYSYRHAFAADLKRDGFDTEKVAQAMGHASDRSQGSYGQANQGKGGRGLVEVEASREVKQREAVRDRMAHMKM